MELILNDSKKTSDRIFALEKVINKFRSNNFSNSDLLDLEMLYNKREAFMESLPSFTIKRKIDTLKKNHKKNKFYSAKTSSDKIEFNSVEYVRKISIPLEYGKFLYFFCRRLRFSRILELGTGFGISTMYLLQALKRQPIGFLTSVEKSFDYAPYYKNLFQEFNQKKYALVIGRKETALTELLDCSSFDLVFQDADHSKEKLVPEIEELLRVMRSGSVLILDDINWSRDMQSAWKLLTKSSYLAYHTEFSFDGKQRPRFGILLKR